ncbi:PUTATIVE ZINC PROTEASE PROTEIN [hydrothermal vent metagenome]|uniref:PUTATIVE ZINC PROTEASE PROTEIN n=1 Tax=hydrothermal vent metagenome TaxID=652676 RepID=A0A3B1B9S7_9ZZZZ
MHYKLTVLDKEFRKNSHLKKAVLVLLFLWLGGCSSAGYYWDAVSGHAELLNAQRSLDEVLADPAVSVKTRETLKTMLKAREFASQELGLPDNDSYRNYVDLGREYAVWNVVATAQFSLSPKQGCFVFVGCISYRGYYRQAQAQDYADSLQAEGLDVQVSGARAYSTLGWSDDPLLNTMLYRSEARQVGIIFHELAHQQLYIKGDSTFNESFATAVEQEGIRRWFLAQGNSAGYQRYQDSQQRDEQFKQLLLQVREELQLLYQAKKDVTEKQEEKVQIFSELKQHFARLRKTDPAFSVYEGWMAQDLNNAHLALIATYNEYVPAFAQLLKEKQGELPAFYAELKKIAQEDALTRRNLLHQWAKKAR